MGCARGICGMFRAFFLVGASREMFTPECDASSGWRSRGVDGKSGGLYAGDDRNQDRVTVKPCSRAYSRCSGQKQKTADLLCHQ